MSTNENDERKGKEVLRAPHFMRMEANLWVKLCIVFIFVSVSVASDFEALNCKPLREYGIILCGKIKLAMKWSSQRVAEQFCEAILYRPMIQDAKVFKARAERR
ncbi:hypothetical protein H5410_036822 [Solanum commersonii]|uniref:Uncharacterized protein n=1 Tax=Solanum commersonii TaxID=4109 RepID=A0A9J5Y9C1_SOLCO|nr:hypothetical protein H5410_036822 [Solanum commersonii]